MASTGRAEATSRNISGARAGRRIGRVDALPRKGRTLADANVAAQAGDIDPAKAAIAAQPGGGATGTGEVALPTFKVKSVRTLDSSCR